MHFTNSIQVTEVRPGVGHIIIQSEKNVDAEIKRTCRNSEASSLFKRRYKNSEELHQNHKKRSQC